MKDGTPRGLNVADDDYYILIEVEELKYQLEVTTWPKIIKLRFETSFAISANQMLEM
jgi:hypothetical protein